MAVRQPSVLDYSRNVLGLGVVPPVHTSVRRAAQRSSRTRTGVRQIITCDKQPPDVRNRPASNVKRQTGGVRLSRQQAGEAGETGGSPALVYSTKLCAWRNNKSTTTVACRWTNVSAAECVCVQLEHVTSHWTVGSPRRQRRTAKRHCGHWVSGPSALTASGLQLQDLSVRLSLSLCLSIAGPMSLTSIRTTLMSRWNTGNWVSGPLVLVIDHQRLHRQQSGQWTTVGSNLLLQRLQSRRLETAKRCNGHWVSGPSALMRIDLRLQDLSASLVHA